MELSYGTKFMIGAIGAPAVAAFVLVLCLSGMLLAAAGSAAVAAFIGFFGCVMTLDPDDFYSPSVNTQPATQTTPQ
jgi:cation transporter-like permease